MNNETHDNKPDRVPILAIYVIGAIAVMALLLIGYGMLNNQRVADMALQRTGGYQWTI
jgi:hypothetical protein